MATINEKFFEFFRKYNGKLVDVDNFPKDRPWQCVDLVRLFCLEALGLPKGTLAPGNAKDIYLNFPNIGGSQYFQKIQNYWWTVPQQGDIVVWREPFGPYRDEKGVLRYAGHIGIINEANIRRFSSFDQNMPTDLRCRLVEHTYTGVIGFLRFKGK
jgi:hypothetical protein